MLPFAIKVVWFCLSLSGLLCLWTVMMIFGKATEWVWGPFMYCVVVSVLQGIFCLGMIWRMDPYSMPKAFCLAQTYIIGICSFILTGACAVLSFATTLLVIQFSKGKAVLPKHAFRWRRSYLFPLIVFPLLASALQITLTLRYNAIRPSDDLHCDATHPVSFRFLGYAGIPQILTIPCFFLSLISNYRIIKTQRHIRRSLPFKPAYLFSTSNKAIITHDDLDTTFTPVPLPSKAARRERTQQTLIRQTSTYNSTLTPLTQSPYLMRCGGLGMKMNETNLPRLMEKYDFDHTEQSSDLKAFRDDQSDYSSRVSHDIPLFASIGDLDGPEVTDCSSSLAERETPVQPTRMPSSSDSVNTTASITWARPGHSRDGSDGPSVRSQQLSVLPFTHPPSLTYDDVTEQQGHSHITTILSHSQIGVLECVEMGSEASHGAKFDSDYDHDSLNFSLETRGAGPSTRQTDIARRPIPPIFRQSKYDRYPHLSPAILRLVTFQMLFAVTEFLAAISTIIDVARHRPEPTPLGTQHVALLLTAWGPVMLFAYSKVPVILFDDIRRWLRSPFKSRTDYVA